MMNKIRLYIVDVVARLRTRASDARRSQDLIRLDAYLTKRPKLGDQQAEHLCKHSGISAVYSKEDI
jgi:hypothetical protein